MENKIETTQIDIDVRALAVLQDIIRLSDEINSYHKGSKPTDQVELISKLIIKEFQMVEHAYNQYKEYVEKNGIDSYIMIVNGDYDIDLENEE